MNTTVTKGIVITKSAKGHPSGKYGACILVYDELSRKVLRLVPNENGDSIIEKYHNHIKVFDVVEFNVIKRAPKFNQVENVVIDLEYGIRKTNICSKDPRTFFNEINKSNNKYIFGTKGYYLTDISKLDHSVEILLVQNLVIYKNEIGKTKAKFNYLNYEYDMFPVTDFEYYYYDNICIKNAYIIVSTPFLDYNKKYYKFVAAVYNLD